MSKIHSIETQMNEKGYKKVAGVAILNDAVVTETIKKTLTLVLKTNEAVKLFNNERNDGWELFRKEIN